MKLTITKEHYEKALGILGELTLANLYALSDRLCCEDPIGQAIKENGGKVVEVYNDWVEIDGNEYDLDENGQKATYYFNKDVDAILFKRKPNNIKHFPMEIELKRATVPISVAKSDPKRLMN